ncbi:MAG: hypothetical protein VX527_10730 [Planctomycetota bacterium]|nr:hypothetical protein [Planctomycetota bacterium]
MGPLLGIILVILGVVVVVLGMTRDLRKCHTERQRSIVWSFAIGAVAAAIIASIFARVLPFWLAWLAWVGLIAALIMGIRWLQTSLEAMKSDGDGAVESA